jgi:putative heme iron utilization protein
MATPSAERSPAIREARGLLRSARVGTLATSAAGQPYAALVTPACAPDLHPLLLLSTLSEHTRHLRAEPRCALLVAGPPSDANPQTAPRVTLTCLAEPADDPAAKARFLAVHPYAAGYAEFADFAPWRLVPMAAMFVGGFARATRLRREELLPDPAAVAAVAAAEASILAHCNADQADALAAIARTTAGGTGGTWRMVTADVDGCDLACGETVLRIPWATPVADPGGIRAELIRLAQAARAAP